MTSKPCRMPGFDEVEMVRLEVRMVPTFSAVGSLAEIHLRAAPFSFMAAPVAGVVVVGGDKVKKILGSEQGTAKGAASERRSPGPQLEGIFCPSFAQFACAVACTHVPAALHSSAVWDLPHDAQSCLLPHEAWSAWKQILPGQQ